MFDITKMETDLTVDFMGVSYKVVNEADCGMLIVAKEDDINNNLYPLQLLAIPDIIRNK